MFVIVMLIYPSFSFSGELRKIDANPDNCFNWAYYLYIPGFVKTPTFILVVPNNSGLPSDDLALHDSKARLVAEDESPMAEYLGTPLLVPTFPRPASDPLVLTQALDRDTLLTTLPKLRRIDLQLIAMIYDARKKLSESGINTGSKVLMMGFSAAGTFTNRFTVIHPEIIQAAVIGGGNPPIVPVATWKGERLRYNVGIDDLAEITGKEIDIEEFKSIPQFFWIGDKDTNDPVDFPDCFELQDKILIDSLFGSTPVERWFPLQEVYISIGSLSQFTMYPDVGHWIPGNVWWDIRNFFLQHLNTERADFNTGGVADFICDGTIYIASEEKSSGGGGGGGCFISIFLD